MLAFRVFRHGGPEALERVDIPRPRPRPDEVLVRVRACAVNHLDLWLRDGVPGHTFPLPLTPGSEVAGTVEEVGAMVDWVSPGSPALVAPGLSCGRCAHCAGGAEMFCPGYGILGEHADGGYAEYLAVPGRNILRLPAGLTFVEAAAIPLVFLTAWHMLVARARLAPGEDVLVHAAGSGVGSAAIQIAALLGARRIIATAGGEDKLARARALGATEAVDYRREDFARRVREVTEGKGVEVVADHVGGEVFERSLRCLARGGRIVLCGATAGATATVNLRAVFFKSLSILGSTMGTRAELEGLLPFFERGRLRSVVAAVLPLAEARQAQEELASRRHFGKVVLIAGETQTAGAAGAAA